jgi:AcrR family transcriptional regulator
MLRQRIIDAAVRLVARGGLAQATVRGIARETGVSTGSVTHYFEDKAEIIHAVLTETKVRVRNRVIEASRGRRGIARVRAAALAVLPIDAERVDTWRAWMAFWPEEYGASSDSGFADGYREWRELIAGAMAQAAADGELPAGLHYRHEADRLGTLLAGLGLLSGTDLATSPRFHERARRMVDEHLARLRLPGI